MKERVQSLIRLLDLNRSVAQCLLPFTRTIRTRALASEV